jgi:DNA polymerase-3 subunit alpha
LHVHTEYSLLDGLSKIPKLVSHAKKLGMGALAITDHGTMFGVIPFFRACKEQEIKPIIGMESYLAKSSRLVHDQSERQPYHLLLLAKDADGYANLLKLATEAQLTGFYNRPRVDKELLQTYGKGLICTSGCLAAEIPRMVSDGNFDKALNLIGTYQDIFGKENFFLELQSHQIPELDTLNKWLIENREYADVPLLATNDVHYVLESDRETHDLLLCIQTGAKINDTKRMRSDDPTYYLRSQADMWGIFGDVAPSALSNTLLVAEMCNVDLNTKGYHLPVFPVPIGHTAESYLKQLAYKGAVWRYGDDAPKFQQRIDYELGIIERMGFATYFLIVWDLLQFARYADIWWNVRGSGAGSAVAYCLSITNIDPIANNLIFERFLNPGRVSMPDIDIDFPDDRRMEMVEYAKRKYGEDKVAAIITFNALKARAAIKDVARVLDFPLDRTNEITALVPNIPSKPMTLTQLLNEEREEDGKALAAVYDTDPVAKDVIDKAISVEGMIRHVGTHAAGIIISDKPINRYLPLHRPTTQKEEAIPIKQVTQFPMEICESIGLLKVDFLGLSTLAIMRKACELIERYHGVSYTLENIPYRPVPGNPQLTRMVEEAFKMMCTGEVTGVFQLESAGMRKTVVEMQPKTFEHITAAISLYRPGPMEFIPRYIEGMHGIKPIEYLHPKLEPILTETYGIVVYQEQVQRIGADLFGYSLADADLMRRAVSKKKKKDLEKHRQIFIEKGPENGVSAEVADEIFNTVEFFASYGFNKSHAADYAVLTCQSAFLKQHYAAEYYIALLTVQRDVAEDVALFAADCKRLGIPILPPNVNASEFDFTIEHENGKRCIRFGLGAIKFVGEDAARQIAEERQLNGTYKSLVDFATRVDLRRAGKRGLESLIKVGAFDQFGERDALMVNLDSLLSFSTKQQKDRERGQNDMFSTSTTKMATDDQFFKAPKDFKRLKRSEILQQEKELIGLYVSSHPLDEFAAKIILLPGHVWSGVLKEEPEKYNGKAITVAGIVMSVRPISTKKGDTMGVITIEDVQGTIEAVLFPRTWDKLGAEIEQGKLHVFRGKADTKREGRPPQIIVDSVTQELELVTAAQSEPVYPHSAPPPNPSMPEPPPTNYQTITGSSDFGRASYTSAMYAPSSVANLPAHSDESIDWLNEEDESPNPPVHIALELVTEDLTAQQVNFVEVLRQRFIACVGHDRLSIHLITPETVYIIELDHTGDYEKFKEHLPAESATVRIQIEPFGVQSKQMSSTHSVTAPTDESPVDESQEDRQPL